MNKILTWVQRAFRKKAAYTVDNLPIKQSHRRLDVHLSVYATVDDSLDLKFLLDNSAYHMIMPEGCNVFRVEVKEFVLN